ncbi:MAG TPA: rhodanese-like domain-containing protein [Aggregatilineales bacterium]|nr:rhodanese-like domain-containing protein [Aggregatilineales bacterium]
MISPKQLKARLDAEEPLIVIDVREDWEVRLSHLPFAINIPMGEIPGALPRIPKDKPVVIMCHHGNRSAQVVLWLARQGFDNVINMTGGIEQWTRDVDRSIPRY